MTDTKEHHHHEHHHHEHHHHEDQPSSLSFEQKLVKRLEHWIAHNEDHADTYREWAARADDKGMGTVGALLKEAALITRDISRKLGEAIQEIPKG